MEAFQEKSLPEWADLAIVGLVTIAPLVPYVG
jgi:hypothetical protein